MTQHSNNRKLLPLYAYRQQSQPQASSLEGAPYTPVYPPLPLHLLTRLPLTYYPLIILHSTTNALHLLTPFLLPTPACSCHAMPCHASSRCLAALIDGEKVVLQRSLHYPLLAAWMQVGTPPPHFTLFTLFYSFPC